jgi:hypothetical protein
MITNSEPFLFGESAGALRKQQQLSRRNRVNAGFYRDTPFLLAD